MTLIEAIKSGRPFRHKSWSGWHLTYDPGDEDRNACFVMNDGKPYGGMAPSYILSEDWETIEPTVTITRAQFWEAAKACIPVHVRYSDKIADGDYIDAGDLARRLGLEPEK